MSVPGARNLLRGVVGGGMSLSLGIGTDRHHPSIFRPMYVKLYGALGYFIHELLHFALVILPDGRSTNPVPQARGVLIGSENVWPVRVLRLLV